MDIQVKQMKVYIVISGTYDDSEILGVFANKDNACEFAKSQGKNIDFCYGDEGSPEQVMRVRFKEQDMYDYVVEQYKVRGMP